MYCFMRVLLFLTFAFSSIYYTSEARKSSPAVVVGTVYCDKCFHKDVPEHSHFISGASVAVECKGETAASTNFRQQVLTDERGEFRVKLPFPISKHARKIKGCSVKLISSNRPHCSIAAVASSSSLHLRSRKRGTHIFSAGFFTFKPLNMPKVCDQRPNINYNNNDNNSIKKLNGKKKPSPYADPNDPSFPPPLQDPPPSDPPGLGHLLPPLPSLPPLIPQLPPLPGIPILPPNPKKGTDNTNPSDNNNNNEAINQPESFPFFPPNPLNPPSLFPPNPFLPPPSLIPPILPTPPPSLFPPILPTPSPPPFFQLPPLPGLTPSPPPPPPPVFPIPLPPFPFQPTPGFPGVPPAGASKRSSP